MSVRRSERGFLSFTAILGLLFVVVMIFLAFKLLPHYINNYQLQDEIENLARTATYSVATESEIRKAIQSRANELGLRLEDRQITVRKGRGTVDIAVHYEVPVDLLARQVVLTFDPGAGNRNITAR